MKSGRGLTGFTSWEYSAATVPRRPSPRRSRLSRGAAHRGQWFPHLTETKVSASRMGVRIGMTGGAKAHHTGPPAASAVSGEIKAHCTAVRQACRGIRRECRTGCTEVPHGGSHRTVSRHEPQVGMGRARNTATNGVPSAPAICIGPLSFETRQSSPRDHPDCVREDQISPVMRNIRFRETLHLYGEIAVVMVADDKRDIPAGGRTYRQAAPMTRHPSFGRVTRPRSETDQATISLRNGARSRSAESSVSESGRSRGSMRSFTPRARSVSMQDPSTSKRRRNRFRDQTMSRSRKSRRVYALWP